MAILAVFAGLGGVVFLSASQHAEETLESEQPPVACCGAPAGATQTQTHTLVGSYYSLKDGQETTLMFNNKGPAPLVVTPTFFSLSGERLDFPVFTIPATSYQEFDLRALLSNWLPQFEEGSLQVSHNGIRLQLGAQFKILKQGMLFDDQFVTPASRFPSSRMESVWWMPSTQCDTKFIISNTTGAPVTATVTVDGTAPGQHQPATIQLNPHQTRVLDILKDLVGQQNGGTVHKEGGISITHSGAPGALLARLLVSRESTGYSSVVNFTDPTTPRSSKQHGGGLRLGSIGSDELEPIVVARNIGSQQTRVSGRVPYTNANGEVVFVVIPEVQIPAGKIKTIDVERAVRRADVPPDVTFTGIELEYSTAPGSVVMSAQSVSRSGQQVFQVPLLDPQRMPSSAGGFPWKVDGDYTTVIFIKNETATPKEYLAQLFYEGGTYSTKVKTVKPSQTVALDFKQMRDAQTPDANGYTIPSHIERGQIAWSMIGADNNTMSGRSEQVNTVRGVSSTYACYNCCPNDVKAATALPAFFGVYAGYQHTYQFSATVESCNAVSSTSTFDGYNWSSSNTSVGTIDYYGLATGVNAGTAYLTGYFDQVDWTYNFATSSCSAYYDTVPGTGAMEVRPNVSVDNFDAVGKNQTATIKVTVSNNPSNEPITLILEPNSGTGVARFTSNDTTTRTITQTTNVEIKGITESSTNDNMRLRATFGSSQLDSEDFTVISLELSLRSTGQVSSDNSARNAYNQTIGTYNIGGPFLNSNPDETLIGIGVEIKATVLPTGFSKNIKLNREIVSIKNHIRADTISNWTENTNCKDVTSPPQPPCEDTSNPVLRDDTPSVIYDLDFPGANFTSAAAVGRIRRKRVNFREWATVSQKNGGSTVEDVRVSADINWFFRLSIHKTTSGIVEALFDVTGDNTVGTGTTPLSANLQ